MRQLDNDHTLQIGNLSITLDHLEQWRTYSGLLEGHPVARINDGLIEHALQRARALRPSAKAYLLAPTRRSYLRTPGDSRSDLGSFGPIEWLPLVTCVAVFMVDFRTELPVVWFQADYAMPIADEALAALHTLPWTALATEIDW